MESPRKKMVVEEGGDGGDGGGESSESVVLQCTESGAVEAGEEVAMADSTTHSLSARRRGELPYTDRRGSLTVALQAYCEKAKGWSKGDDSNACVESKEDAAGERKAVASVRCVDRSLGGRKIILTPRMASFRNEGGYWRTGGRRRYRAWKSFSHGPFGVDASVVVERAAMKRNHEEVEQCSPAVLEARQHEDNESDNDSASSSDSDASESESEQWRRRGASSKRRRVEDLCGKSAWNDESLKLRSGVRKIKPSLMAEESGRMEEEEEGADYADDELKEMQQLLELQLQAAERREAGMKQRMEQMMDVLSQHMGHVEKRVSNLEQGVQPQEQVLERINVKLEKVMEGFSALNENLAILSACLSKDLESQ